MKGGPPGLYAWTVKVGEKGQIVIPKEARSVFEIAPGDTLLLLGDIEKGLAIVKGETMAQLASEVMNYERKEKPDDSDNDK